QYLLGFPVPFRTSWRYPFLAQRRMQTHGRFVEAQFHYREIGCSRLEEFAKLQLSEAQLSLIQVLQRIPEVQEHYIAFMPQEREESGLALLHSGEHSDGFFQNTAPALLRKASPGLPPDAEHLVEYRGAFQCQRDFILHFFHVYHRSIGEPQRWIYAPAVRGGRNRLMKLVSNAPARKSGSRITRCCNRIEV